VPSGNVYLLYSTIVEDMIVIPFSVAVRAKFEQTFIPNMEIHQTGTSSAFKHDTRIFRQPN